MRRTKQLLAVLRALANATRPCHTRWGYEIVQETGLVDTTVYDILHRLQDLGWLVSESEPSGQGKPPRRCYRFTELGETEARKMLDP